MNQELTGLTSNESIVTIYTTPGTGSRLIVSRVRLDDMATIAKRY
jgi:hypothetical protein